MFAPLEWRRATYTSQPSYRDRSGELTATSSQRPSTSRGVDDGLLMLPSFRQPGEALLTDTDVPSAALPTSLRFILMVRQLVRAASSNVLQMGSCLIAASRWSELAVEDGNMPRRYGSIA